MSDRRLAFYARAIYEAALARWIVELTELRDRLRQDDAARAYLSDETKSFEERQAMVDRLLPEDATPELRNLVYILARDGSLGLLDDIINDVRRLVRHGPDVVLVRVTTAVPLDDEMRREVEQTLVSRYGNGLDIEWTVDPQIVGGIVVQVGDELINGSVATRLETLRRSLQQRV